MSTLVIRPDRLGDVILSTPVLEVLHQRRPGDRITVLVRSNVVPLLKGLPGVEDCIVFDPQGEHEGWSGFLKLVSQLRLRKFQVALVLQSHPRIAAAIFLARIPVRIGPLSKLHSYFFYNQGMRQHRSRVEKHETDYNLQLLEKLGIHAIPRQVATSVVLDSQNQKEARRWLGEQGFQKGIKKWIAVHPGMGGSALNWPEDHYRQLIQALLQAGRGVMITTGPEEINLSRRLEAALSSFYSKPNAHSAVEGGVDGSLIFYRAERGDSLSFLAGVYSEMDLVVAPSTGPLHLAVALGRRVLTFYPTLRVQSAKRWGPYVINPTQAVVLEPKLDCSKDSECMKSITVQEALQASHQLLSLPSN